MSGSTSAAPAGQTQVAPPAAPLRLEFTDGCSFAADANGLISITWDNGNAIRAVKGAAVDYVDPKFHFACQLNGATYTYNGAQDFARLTAGGVEAKLALIVVGIRKVAMSLPGCVLNNVECAIEPTTTAAGTISAQIMTTLVAQRRAFNAVIDLSLTILGLNGISLLTKGHHYVNTDSMWERLAAAVDLESMMTQLGVANYEGVIFHDALHPIDIAYKATLVTDAATPLIGKVNGVLMKRLPGMPAGTGTFFVTMAALEQVSVIRPQIQTLFQPALEAMRVVAKKIKSSPLEYCAVFQQAGTAVNLAEVSKYDPIGALVYGIASALMPKRASLLKSIAFKNNAQRNPGLMTVGREYGESMADAVFDDAAMTKVIQAMIDATK
jgi:hypothetical protein